MWVVAKIKIKNLNTFKKNIREKMGDGVKFYQPKFEYHKSFGDKVKKFEKNPNKINYIYVLTPRGIAEKTKLTLNFMKRKMKEYEELKREIKD